MIRRQEEGRTWYSTTGDGAQLTFLYLVELALLHCSVGSQSFLEVQTSLGIGTSGMAPFA